MTGVRLGRRANARQFGLLVGITLLVGEEEFGLVSRTAILAFVATFGAAKGAANLFSGSLAERSGRKHVLVLGWLLVLPVGPIVALAPSWATIVAANVFLGAGQGVAWSMTIVMNIDLVGPLRARAQSSRGCSSKL